MSQEPHPPTDQTTPGSTPAQEPGAASALERQRAEGDYPPEPAPDPLDAAAAETNDEHEGGEERNTDPAAPPDRTVPDEVAEQAARDVDPVEGRPDPGMQHQNPMRPATSTSDIQKERPPAEDL